MPPAPQAPQATNSGGRRIHGSRRPTGYVGSTLCPVAIVFWRFVLRSVARIMAISRQTVDNALGEGLRRLSREGSSMEASVEHEPVSMEMSLCKPEI